ncbi:5'-3' exoribonuclease [Aureococcus anophagefferens]|nr:5'-3' exoribonuclease [Aureococcus anophagefferens]
MGVPAFFRWLAARYPPVMMDLLEGEERGPYDAGTEASLVRDTTGQLEARWVQVENFSASSCRTRHSGEGEHKIMDWIRRSQADPDRRGERHAVCGQDADLMFLSLALHAPRVYVLRERVETAEARWRRGRAAGARKAFGPPRLQYLSCQRLRRCLIGDASLNAAADGALPFPRDDDAS